MAKFDRQIATATRLIKENGQLVTWRQNTDGAPLDSNKPWLPGTTSAVDNSVYIVFLPEDRRDMEFLKMLTGSEIPKGKLVGLMAAQNFIPTLKDTVIRGTETLGIRAIDVLSPNGQTILYTIRFDL